MGAIGATSDSPYFTARYAKYCFVAQAAHNEIANRIDT